MAKLSFNGNIFVILIFLSLLRAISPRIEGSAPPLYLPYDVLDPSR
jgi:hypothetical protein